MNNNTLFVYGTLLSGECRNHALTEHEAEKVADTTTKAEFTLYNMGSFPGLADGGDTIVKGEVWKINDECFQRIDRIEGFPTLYNRKQIQLENGMNAWVYYVNDNKWIESRGKQIKSGDWVCR